VRLFVLTRRHLHLAILFARLPGLPVKHELPWPFLLHHDISVFSFGVLTYFFRLNVQAPADKKQRWFAMLLSTTITQSMPDDRQELPEIATFPEAKADNGVSIKTEVVEDPVFPAGVVRMEEEEEGPKFEGEVRPRFEEEAKLKLEEDARRLEEETKKYHDEEAKKLQEKEERKYRLLYPSKSLWSVATYALTSDPSPGPFMARTESISRIFNFRVPSREDFAVLPSDTADCLINWVQSNVEGTHFYDASEFDRLSSYFTGASS